MYKLCYNSVTNNSFYSNAIVILNIIYRCRQAIEKR